MQVWWGPNLTYFYNDAYSPSLGKVKHPAALGRSARDVWAEIWDVIGPMIEKVRTTGEASWSEDLLMFFDRELPKEEVYVTFSFSPVFGEGNKVDGIFCADMETTEKVVGNRRLETLRKPGIRATESQSVEAACRESAEVLGTNPYDIPFAALYVVNDEGTHAALKSLAGFSHEVQPFPSLVSLSDGDLSLWPLASVLQTRRAAETSDLVGACMSLPGGPWPEPASTARTPSSSPSPAKLRSRCARSPGVPNCLSR